MHNVSVLNPANHISALILSGVLIFACALTNSAYGQGMRDRVRIEQEFDPSTVTEMQAVAMTLTVVETRQQQLQTWLRLAARLDIERKILIADTCHKDAALVEPSQRVRAFTPNEKSSIVQARVTNVIPQERNDKQGCFRIEAKLLGNAHETDHYYVMQVIIPLGTYLAIPKEAIINDDGKQIVYLEGHPGHYMVREIKTGLEGELYTVVTDGLSTGNKVVTIGSFFVDAENKLNTNNASEGDSELQNVHHHH